MGDTRGRHHSVQASQPPIRHLHLSFTARKTSLTGNLIHLRHKPLEMASSQSNRRSRRRRHRRWKNVETAPPPPVRERGRRLDSSADVLQRNAWDDVEMSARTWQQPRQSSTPEPELSGGGGRMPANGGGPLGPALRGESAQLPRPALPAEQYQPCSARVSRRPWGVCILEAGCGVGNTSSLLATSAEVRGLGATTRRVPSRAPTNGSSVRARGPRARLHWDIGKPPPEGDTGVRRGHRAGGVHAVCIPPEAVPRVRAPRRVPQAGRPAAAARLRSSRHEAAQICALKLGRPPLWGLKRPAAMAGRRRWRSRRRWRGRQRGSGAAALPARRRRVTAASGTRGDGTTALFFTTDAVKALAEEAGLHVRRLRYDRRLVVNRASR